MTGTFETIQSDQGRLMHFALVGAQKTATSWIYYCLRDHPELSVPVKKFEAGYVGGEIFNSKGAEWFFSRFEDDVGTVVGDVSVEYMYDPNSLRQLKKFMHADPKILVSLRNPIDRMVSGYYWLIRRGVLPNLPIENSLMKTLLSDFGSTPQVTPALTEVVERGMYAAQMKRLIDCFGEQAVHVICYEDVEENRLTEIQRIYRWLGVDANYVPHSLSSAPKKNSYLPFLLNLENRFGKNKMVARAINYSNQFLLNTGLVKRKAVLSKEQRAFVAEVYRKNIKDLFLELDRLPNNNRPSNEHLEAVWDFRSDV